MKRFIPLVVNPIRKSLKLGLLLSFFLFLAIPVTAANGPDDKDKNKRWSPPSNSRTSDSGSRTEAPRYTPPPPRQQQQSFDSGPKFDRTIRNDAPHSQNFTPPPRNNFSNPPTTSGTSPSVNRNAFDANRVTGGGSSTSRREISPPAKTYVPAANRDNSPANVNRNPPSITTGPNNGKIGVPRDFSPAAIPQFKTFVPKIGPNVSNDLQAQRDTRPSLSDTRKRLNEKKNDPPGNPPADRSGRKTADKPLDKPDVKPFDKPAIKTANPVLDKPDDKIKSIDRGRIDRNPQPGGLYKKPGDTNATIDKGRIDINPQPGGPYKKPDDNSKTIDKGRIDIKNPQPGGPYKKPDKIVPPQDKVAVPSGVKPKDDRGNPTIQKRDAFQPGRFPGGATRKDLPATTGEAKTGIIAKPNPLDKKIDDAKKLGPELLPGRLPQNVRNVDPKFRRPDENHKPFGDRVKSGELDVVTKGEAARKLNLADQYKHMQKGDVARRMDLQKNVIKNVNVTKVNNVTINNLHGVHPHHAFYCGTISPLYVDHCFKYRYYGPAFFAGDCWYPHWHPWVVWSWGYHCHPLWDPRPFWCRPVIYEPYIVWNYWAPPVWQPLPEASVGTWVDVKPVVVEPEQFDLQLLAVRMVDPGHPEEKLGPRYRVWFRNNGNRPVTAPFTVMLFAGNDKRFGPELPRGGVRVTSIEAGDTQSVDIRLPHEVYAMNRDAAGQPAPFEFLHFFVDANRELNDVNMVNNGAVVPREEMLPVDPAAFEADPTTCQAGGELIVAGEGFGPQPGQVLLHVGNREMQAEIVGWYDLGVKIVAPKLDLAIPVEAELIVVRGDGAAANPVKVTLQSDQGAGPLLEKPVGS